MCVCVCVWGGALQLGMAVLELPAQPLPATQRRSSRQSTRLVAADDAIGLCSPRIQGVLAATAAALRSLNNISAAPNKGAGAAATAMQQAAKIVILGLATARQKLPLE
jgi:hypothetical protein